MSSMANYRNKKLFLRFSLTILFCLSSVSSLASPMRIAYAEYPPYSYFDGEAKGIEIEVLNRVLNQQMGIELHHEILPWKRAQSSVEKGLFDAFVSVPTPTRAEYALYSKLAVTYWQASLFVRNNSPLLNNRLTISPQILVEHPKLQLGALRGNGWVEEHLKAANIEYASSMQSLINMLIKGRIDAIPDSRFTMGHYLKQFQYKGQIQELPFNEAKIPMFLHISKKSPYTQVLKEFDIELKKLMDSGELEKIYQKYRLQ